MKFVVRTLVISAAAAVAVSAAYAQSASIAKRQNILKGWGDALILSADLLGWLGAVLPAGDVLRQSADGLSAIDQSLVRVQTPQAFRAAPLLQAYRDAAANGFEGTDTSSCVERFTDVEVHAIAGSAQNFKVTFAHDVQVAETLLSRR